MNVWFYCCLCDFFYEIMYCFNVKCLCIVKYLRVEDIEMIDRNERLDNVI